MKLNIKIDTGSVKDLLDLQSLSNHLVGVNGTASAPDSAPVSIPDALASIAPEPPVITTPAPEEIATTPVAEIPKVESSTPPPPVQTAPPVDDDNFDVTGLPWDGRIHSSGKTKTTKGAWTRRRNLDDAYYAQILAEISAAPKAAAEQAQIDAEVSAHLDGDQGQVPEAPVPEIPAAADAGFGGVSTGEMTWPDVVQVVMKAKVQELVSQEQLDQKAGELGIAGGFNNLVSRPDLYARYIMELGI